MLELSLNHDFILLQNPFIETTRKGKFLSFVNFIALTPRNLLVKSDTEDIYSYPLERIKLSIFKNSQRQCIKLCFNNETKYFEFEELRNRNIYWKLWCLHINELKEERKLWPFNGTFKALENTFQRNRRRWTDKYVYLGSNREEGDKDRPKPVPGLNLADNINLFYLKPEYFGCWDQSEHWVQCSNSSVLIDSLKNKSYLVLSPS